MAAAFAEGWIWPLLLAGVVLEALALLAHHRRTGRGLAPADVAALTLPGVFLMAALWAAAAGAAWGLTAAALAGSGLAHLAALRQRWRPGPRAPG